jgi:septum formation protein
MNEIVLASASPRRAELMELAQIPFKVIAADIPEKPLENEEPAAYALRLAADKATSVADKRIGRWFIGADTIVVLDNRIMGKPRNANEAAAMLGKLSGHTHQVITAFAVFDVKTGDCTSRAVYTDVQFKNLSDLEIEKYVATGCPLDKAGAYAIQGGAAHFVQEIHGSYTNVVGLPACELVELLQQMGALEKA